MRGSMAAISIVIKANPILGFIYAAVTIYKWVLIIRIILSWIQIDPHNALIQFIRSLTDPVLIFVREKVPIRAGMIDLSPLLVFFALELISRGILMFALK